MNTRHYKPSLDPYLARSMDEAISDAKLGIQQVNAAVHDVLIDLVECGVSLKDREGIESRILHMLDWATHVGGDIMLLTLRYPTVDLHTVKE